MFYKESLQDTRQMLFDSWDKYQHRQLLSPLEQEIVQVIKDHPEYHPLLEKGSLSQPQHYYPELGETNPFLHIGLHLAIREQVTTNRPAGIQAIYQQLVKKYADPLLVEHQMMEQLAERLWVAQKNRTQPDEFLYLEGLKGLLNNP